MNEGELAPEARRFEAQPHRTFAALSLPVVVSLVAEPITGLVDTAFVARLGANELAALGVGAVLISSSVWIFNFLGVGTQTEVAHALGARDPLRARNACGVAVALGAGIGTALGVLLAPWLGGLVALMGAEGEVADAARAYVGIRLLGAPPMLVMMAATGALRGLHDMRTPLWIAVGANAANIALDPLLIFGAGPIPAMGVAGAAWATSASFWGAGLVSWLLVRRRLGRPERVELGQARALLVVGRDLFLRTGLLVLFIALTTRAATRIGSDSGAAHQVIRQVWITTALLLDAFAHVAQSLVGTSLGSGRVALARRAARVAVAWSLLGGVGIGAAMLLGRGAVALALVPTEAVAVFAAAWGVAALAQPINALSFASDGIHWGTRDYRYLRNAMALSFVVGAAGLFHGEWSGRESLTTVWAWTAVWMSVRAVAGMGRIWPGWGRSPLGAR